MALNGDVVEAVTNEEFKNVASLHALTAGLAGQNQLSQQNRLQSMADSVLGNAMNAAQQMAQLAAQQALQISQNGSMLAQAMTGRVSRHILDVSAEQAAGFVTQLGARLEDKLTNLGSTLAGIEQFAKIGAATPPQTGTGGAFGSDAGSALLQQLANIQATLQSLESRVTRTTT